MLKKCWITYANSPYDLVVMDISMPGRWSRSVEGAEAVGADAPGS